MDKDFLCRVLDIHTSTQCRSSPLCMYDIDANLPFILPLLQSIHPSIHLMDERVRSRLTLDCPPMTPPPLSSLYREGTVGQGRTEVPPFPSFSSFPSFPLSPFPPLSPIGIKANLPSFFQPMISWGLVPPNLRTNDCNDWIVLWVNDVM